MMLIIIPQRTGTLFKQGACANRLNKRLPDESAARLKFAKLCYTRRHCRAKKGKKGKKMRLKR